MTAANNLTWAFFRDGDRYILGAYEWQTRSLSSTKGIWDVDATEEKAKPGLMARARDRAQMLSREAAEALRKDFNTWDRFEDGCDRGVYGPEW